MAHDPLSHVASWLTPASADATDTVEDPVIALIAEGNRLAALRIAACGRGDEIFDTLPKDIREGRVRVSFSDSELGQCISGLKNCFRSEIDLQSFLNIWRRWPTARAERDGKSPEAALAEFDREIGLDQALVQLRAGLEEIKAIREASGYEAHYREAEARDERADAIFDQICNTPPRTLAGGIAMLRIGKRVGKRRRDRDEEPDQRSDRRPSRHAA
jgi:hypothetical protein